MGFTLILHCPGLPLLSISPVPTTPLPPAADGLDHPCHAPLPYFPTPLVLCLVFPGILFPPHPFPLPTSAQWSGFSQVACGGSAPRRFGRQLPRPPRPTWVHPRAASSSRHRVSLELLPFSMGTSAHAPAGAHPPLPPPLPYPASSSSAASTASAPRPLLPTLSRPLPFPSFSSFLPSCLCITTAIVLLLDNRYTVQLSFTKHLLW